MAKESLSLEGKFLELLDELDYGSDIFVSRTAHGIFTPCLTMFLMMTQRLGNGSSLLSALKTMHSEDTSEIKSRNTRSKRFNFGEISGNSGGYSRARQRLSLELVREVSEGISSYLVSNKGSVKERQGEQRVFIFDGTTIRMDRSPANLEKYPPVRNKVRAALAPNIQVGCVHELYTGVALCPHYGPYRGEKATHESKLFIEMLEKIPVGSLLIADRGLGSFPLAYAAERKGVDLLVRLSTSRAKSLDRQTGSKGKDTDSIVQWQLKKTRLTELSIPEGATITGRFIRHTVKRKGHRPLELLFYTNSKKPLNEIVKLYAQRERIENDIRTLKYILGMNMLFTKTPEMIEKELLLGFVAYNIVRSIIASSARKLSLKPRDISFTAALHNIVAFGGKLRLCKDSKEQKRTMTSFMHAMSQSKLPKRTHFRIEPRKIVHERRKFARLLLSREEEREKIQTTLKEYGHRGYLTSVSRAY